MAKLLSAARRSGILLQPSSLLPQVDKANVSHFVVPKHGRKWLALLGVATAGGVGLVYALENSVKASDLQLLAPTYPFNHNGFFSSLDMTSVRRGYQVYKQVCAACHSLKYIKYIYFVDQFMTEAEAKAEAQEMQVEDGPDDTGKMFKRPGGLLDTLPSPYPNEAAAKFANNGAFPPDMSRITLTKMALGSENYIFALLTSYVDTPAGVELGEGQAYNPWFANGAISMPQQLFDDMLQFEDGTKATISQMAKDVSTFLAWCGKPRFDQEKKLRLQVIMLLPVFAFSTWYYSRFIWLLVKTAKNYWKPHPFLPRK